MDTKVVTHFQKHDPRIAALFTTIPLEGISPGDPDTFFAQLCRNIIGQQLSGKAADTIYARFETLFSGKRITPEAVLMCSDESLRAVGMSRAKAAFIRDLAANVQNKDVDLQSLPTLPDAGVIATLTKVKGIGPWTAEMFLIFTLGREDVFSFGDLGLRQGIQQLYGLRSQPTNKQMEKLSKRWIPYRSYAARVLWRYKDRE